MSKVEVSAIPKSEHDELCCTYATLLLHDEGINITEEQLKKVIDASGNKVDQLWTKLFAKALKDVDVSNFFGCAVAAPSGSSAPVQAEAKKVEKAEAPKEEPKEEEEADMDMGDLFAF